MLIRQNDEECPNCDNRHGLIHKSERDPMMVCQTCGETWHPTTDGMRNVLVEVVEPLSIWKGERGLIKEILPGKGRNVRVQFNLNKQVYGDLFHPAHLVEL